MSSKLLPAAVFATLTAPAWAEVPRVATDIAPVQSLVARVMQGVGTPDLIVAPGASPHSYSLRPSEAAALQEAGLIVWIGPDLTPWLADAVATLAPGAGVVTLLSVEGTTVLPFREGATFEAHDHDGHDDHDDHGHDDHDHDHGHDDHAGDKDDAHDDHAHGASDPHAWLAPANAAVWMGEIAAQLSALDPGNAPIYAANAAAGQQELADLGAELAASLAPLHDRPFVVFHDAYQYFEQAFDMAATGAISLSDASDPSPARIAEIRDRIADQGVACVLSEPQFDPGIVAAVMDGLPARTGVIDPLGADLEPGPGLYPAMLRNMAQTLSDCLK